MHHKFIQHLLEDHQKQRELGKKLREAKQPEERKNLWAQYYEETYPHIIGEEASIFEYLQNEGEKPREETLKALQEHHIAKIVMNEMMELSPEGEVFPAKAYLLDELNRHHMEEEEKTHFPMLERLASDEIMDQLFKKQYEPAEKKAEERAESKTSG